VSKYPCQASALCARSAAANKSAALARSSSASSSQFTSTATLPPAQAPSNRGRPRLIPVHYVSSRGTCGPPARLRHVGHEALRAGPSSSSEKCWQMILTAVPSASGITGATTWTLLPPESSGHDLRPMAPRMSRMSTAAFLTCSNPSPLSGSCKRPCAQAGRARVDPIPRHGPQRVHLNDANESSTLFDTNDAGAAAMEQPDGAA